MPADNIIDPTGFRKVTGYMPVSQPSTMITLRILMAL